jgi:chorismate dehydratase
VHSLEPAAAAAQLYDFSAAYLDHYFDQLKYGFPVEYRRGLAEFYRRAQAIGELEQLPSLVLDTAPPVGD